MASTVASEAAPPDTYSLIPLLLGKRSCNITFVLDSSDEIRVVLGSVKHLLIEALMTKASLRDSMFNVMTFSSKVSCWSNHMLPCASDTVYKALSWIHSISYSPGRDLLAALSIALTDAACHAVHLITTGLPDHPESVLRALPLLLVGRCLTTFYLLDSNCQLDTDTQDYLQCLAHTIRGSCFVITVGSNGALEKVFPLCVERHWSVPAPSPDKCCCPFRNVTTQNRYHAYSPLLRCSLGNHLHPVTTCVLSCQSLGCSEFYPGCRVLARRELDGLYYLGTVIQHVQGRRGLWVIQFDHPGSAGVGVVSSRQQLVCSFDMIKHTTVRTRSLTPGDAVLSPWEPDLQRYGPADGIVGLQVLMWNGCTSLVPSNLVLLITAHHHDRLVKELQTQIAAPGQCDCCSCFPQLCQTDSCHSASTCCCSSASNQWACMAPPTFNSSSGRMDRFERAERVNEVDLKDTDMRRSEPELHSSSSSSVSDSRVVLPPAVKKSRKQECPPWRYWRRTGPEPQHRQPGNTVPRRTLLPARFSYPVPQISASPNHSSLFQSLPTSQARRANIREVFGCFRPRPPARPHSLCGNNISAIHK